MTLVSLRCLKLSYIIVSYPCDIDQLGVSDKSWVLLVLLCSNRARSRDMNNGLWLCFSMLVERHHWTFVSNVSVVMQCHFCLLINFLLLFYPLVSFEVHLIPRMVDTCPPCPYILLAFYSYFCRRLVDVSMLILGMGLSRVCAISTDLGSPVMMDWLLVLSLLHCWHRVLSGHVLNRLSRGLTFVNLSLRPRVDPKVSKLKRLEDRVHRFLDLLERVSILTTFLKLHVLWQLIIPPVEEATLARCAARGNLGRRHKIVINSMTLLLPRAQHLLGVLINICLTWMARPLFSKPTIFFPLGAHIRVNNMRSLIFIHRGHRRMMDTTSTLLRWNVFQ